MDLKNKVIAITGAGNGLGRELSLKLLDLGAHIAGIDINEERLRETKSLVSKHSKNFSIHVMDITNKELVNKLPEEIISIHGNIDGIINNAGIIQPFKNFIDLEDQEIDRVMNINFFSTMYLTKIFLPILLTRPKALIANVSSMGGFFPFPKQTIYGSSKAAVKLFTEGLQTELEHTNIHVISVLPGGMNTNIMKNSNVQMNKKTEGNQKTMKILSPQEAAEIIVRGISKNKHKILVGKDAKMMDILYRISPTLAPKAISKAMNKVLN